MSECLDKGRGTPAPFKYEAKLEPHKLFVSNLPQKYTELEVLETFTKHGQWISKRLVHCYALLRTGCYAPGVRHRVLRTGCYAPSVTHRVLRTGCYALGFAHDFLEKLNR